jgi:hypothetical protein
MVSELKKLKSFRRDRRLKGFQILKDVIWDELQMQLCRMALF